MKTCIEGIFLRKIPFSDSSSIVYIYTAEHGVIPFLHRNKTKNNNLFFPLNILNINTHIKVNRDIQHIEQITTNSVLFSIRENIHKLNVAQFMADFLYQILQFPITDYELFNFLKKWILFLESASHDFLKVLHIYGLMQLTKYLGIKPQNNFSDKNPYFNLINACFCNEIAIHTLPKDLSLLWTKILSKEIDDLINISITKKQKYELINSILNYYSIHFQKEIKLNSLQVLQEVYD